MEFLAFGDRHKKSVHPLRRGKFDAFGRKLFRRTEQDQVPVAPLGKEAVKALDFAPSPLCREFERRQDVENISLSFSHDSNYSIFVANMVRNCCEDDGL